MSSASDRLSPIIAATGAIQPTIAPDGTLHFLTDRSGAMQLWAQRADGQETRLTDVDRVGAYAVDPEGGRVALVADQGGSQQWGLHSVSSDGSDLRTISVAPRRVHHLVGWTTDGNGILAFANLRDRRYLDLFRFPTGGGSADLVFANEGSGMNATALEDGGVVLAVHRDRMQHHHLVHVDALGNARELTPDQPRAKYEKPRATDGGVLTLTNRDQDTIGVARVGLDGSFEMLVESDWDVQSLAKSGPSWAYEINRDGLAEIHVVADGVDQIVYGHPAGALRSEIVDDPLAVGANGDVAFELRRYDQPSSIWLARTGAAAELAVAPSMAGVDPTHLPVAESVEWQSRDGLRIPGFLLRPQAGGTRPTIVDLHGGTGQSRPTWSAWTVGLIASGFNVLFPNVRGSSGYGRRYQSLDEREHRLDSVRDVHEAAEWLVREGIAPADKVGIMGSSYGGYMTLAAITFHPSAWAAAVELFGISDYVRHLESLPTWRRRLREAEFGTLVDDHDLLKAISPLQSLENIRTPLLIIHGANDTLVAVEQSELLVDGLRSRGREVEFLRFEDEGHVIHRAENIAVMVERIVTFFERTLG